MTPRAGWLAGAAALAALAGCAPRTPPPAPPPVPAPVVAPPVLRLDGAAVQGGIVRGVAPAGTVALALDGTAVRFAPDGGFVIGFDRDAGRGASLVATLGDGRRVVRDIAVAPRSWPIERLDRVEKIPVPSADFQRRRPVELTAIARARAIASDSAGWRQTFRWPATGRISGVFGAQRIYRGGAAGAYHSGVDIARPTGTPVLAPADGLVILVANQPFTLEGYLLMIDHGLGLNSAFLHLSRIDVAPGTRVRQGQRIGLIGATGRASGAHLHWGMKWGEARVDPVGVLGVEIDRQ